jgi:hypothetical protein
MELVELAQRPMVAKDVPLPFGFEDPPHMVHEPSGFRAWLTVPAGVITQVTTQVRADEPMARFLSTTVSRAVLDQPRARGERLLFIHDWRRLDGYAPEARKILTDWGIGIRDDIERIVVALRSDTSPLVRMGISVASVALRLAGVQLDLVDSTDDVIRELGIVPRGDVTP